MITSLHGESGNHMPNGGLRLFGTLHLQTWECLTFKICHYHFKSDLELLALQREGQGCILEGQQGILPVQVTTQIVQL